MKNINRPRAVLLAYWDEVICIEEDAEFIMGGIVMEDESYFVSGCGITVLCARQDVVGWIHEFIDRGGVPVIKKAA